MFTVGSQEHAEQVVPCLHTKRLDGISSGQKNRHRLTHTPEINVDHLV